MNKKNNVKYMSAVLLASLTFGTQAQSAPLNMETTGMTSQPIGHHVFCTRKPAECQPTASGKTDPMALSREQWQTMLDVNYHVNTTIMPRTDMEMHGIEEYWSYPVDQGDCEDYALEKRRLLMERGFSASDLLITVVLQPDGSGHAVLTVRTQLGDFVLDNMRDRVLLWADTEYVFLKRQSTTHAGQWSQINDGRGTLAVGAVR
jgi:predicted transglutaminase-like cysteine proteinase